MMARSTQRFNQRPDTLMHDRTSANSTNSLAPHGRTIHWVRSGPHAVTQTSPLRPQSAHARVAWICSFSANLDSRGAILARLEGRRVMDQDIDFLGPKRAQDDDRVAIAAAIDRTSFAPGSGARRLK